MRQKGFIFGVCFFLGTLGAVTMGQEKTLQELPGGVFPGMRGPGGMALGPGGSGGPRGMLGAMGLLPNMTAQQERQEAENIVTQWKGAQNESDRNKTEQELRDVLKKQFLAHFSAHEKEIEQLEAEVKRLREQLELRRKNQDEIVDFRMQQLLRDAQGLGWGAEAETPRGGRGVYRPAMP